MAAGSSTTISKAFVNLLIIAMILSGAANTIGLIRKYNMTEEPSSNGQYKAFVHPFMQATTMFLGESLCFILFIFAKRQTQYKSDCIEASAKGLKTKVNYGWLAIPAMCDLLASTLAYISLNYIPPSIYQMLRGGAIISTAFMSKFFLKKKIQKYQWIGCVLVLIGITSVGASGFIFPQKSTTEDDKGIGMAYIVSIVLLLLSVVMNGLQFVSEEKLFDTYFLHPFEVVGVEGMWGFVVYVILSVALTFTPCPDAMKESCIPKDGIYYFERADYYFQQALSSALLMFWVVLGVFTIATFNICGVSVTKYVSSLARSIVDVSRTVVIWMVALIITWTHPNNPAWENTRVGAIIIELIGFLILVTGNLVYNGTIRLPGNLGYKKVESDGDESLVANSLQPCD